MKTKLLSAAGCAAALLAAGAAQAQVPIANTYYAGYAAEYVAVALQSAGGPHVIFSDYFANYEWDPFSSSVWAISGSYSKRFDAVAYFAAADGPFDGWDFDNGVWINPGLWSSDGYPTSFKELSGYATSNTPDGDVTIYNLNNGTWNTYLGYNGRREQMLNLFDNRLAYQYQDPSGYTWVAVHELSSNTQLFHSFTGKDRRPDISGDVVAWEDHSNGGIAWAKLGYASGFFPPPAGCSNAARPLVGNWGEWIIYAVDCGGDRQLWLHHVDLGFDQFLDVMNPTDVDYFHTVANWLVYSDKYGKLTLIEFGPSAPACDVPYLPADGVWDSGLIGRDPTVVLDGSGKWHALFATASNTIDWVPGNAPSAVGPAMSAYDGVYYNAAAVYMNNVWAYHVDVGAWTWIAGNAANPGMYKDFLAWTDTSDALDRAIGWGIGTIGSFSTGVSFAGNGRHEQRPAVFDQRAAIEQFNGSWDVRIVDVQTATSLALFGGGGNQSQPDLWDRSVAYLDDVNGLQWVKDYAWTLPQPIPTPTSCCSTFERPRLGSWGNWVVFEASNCTHGKRELRLVNMDNGNELLLDYLAAPVNGQPQYDLHEDQLVYVREDGRVIFVDLDATQI